MPHRRRLDSVRIPRARYRSRSWGLVLGCLILVTAAVPEARTADTPALQTFLEASRSEDSLALDDLARRINAAQMPLVMRAVDRIEARDGEELPGAYEAFSRWHFWQGRRWDHAQRGLWGCDPLWTPAAGGDSREASATLASMEILQLESLASMAMRRGLTFDALVWWTERRNLVRRLQQVLYDPLQGSYADLDSLGRRVHDDALGTLLPLAMGADFLPGPSRRQAERVWFEDPEASAAQRRTVALDRARSYAAGNGGLALRLVPAPVSAALTRGAMHRLMDVELATEVSDALTLAGLAPQDSLTLPMGSWEISLATSDLTHSPFGRASVALRFLWQGGFVPDEEIDAVLAQADSLTALGQPVGAESVDALTDRLVLWRSRNFSISRSAWPARRARRPQLGSPISTFHYRDSAAETWIDRALDLLAETIVAHQLQPHPRTRDRARFEPALRGRGDPTRLVVELGITDTPDTNAAPQLQLMWTDGLRVMPPIELTLEPKEARTFVAEVENVPVEEGLWRAMLVGRPSELRQAPAIAVVEPLVAQVVPLPPTRRRHPHRVRLRSQVESPLQGTVEVEVPLDWTVEPGPRITYALGPGETRDLDFVLVPGSESAPGHFDVEWSFYDGIDEIAQQQTFGVRPFRWLTLGPFAATPGLPYAPPAGVIPLDLSRSLPGQRGPVHWQRLSNDRFGPQGAIRPSDSGANSMYYAMTAFTTGSREGRVALEANGRFFLFVNGDEILRRESGGGRQEGTVFFRSGANHVVVGIHAENGWAPEFQLRLRDLEGQPLRGVDDSLEMLLDGYAYVQGDAGEEPTEPGDIARETLRSVPISFVAPEAQRVSVVGSFNGWSPTRSPMSRDENGRWVARIRLRPGRFEYKFAVDGSDWIADPSNPLAVDDGFGGKNSVIVVE